jgi:hypothetical protein
MPQHPIKEEEKQDHLVTKEEKHKPTHHEYERC